MRVLLEPKFEGVLNGNVINGRVLARLVHNEVRQHAKALAAEGLRLKLVVVRVGDDDASRLYVGHKIKACKRDHVLSESIHFPKAVSEKTVLAKIAELNANIRVDGILIQLPLPSHISTDAVQRAVDPAKDVDGFHRQNLGGMIARHSLLEPCTPGGVLVMLASLGVKIKGKHAVIVGRSLIAGRSTAAMLLRANATVTTCHRHTENLKQYVQLADILVSATGIAHLIKGDWIKPGAVVIDVGINRKKNGKLVGDVDFEEAKKNAGAITPVPGGVGPMTVAMLLWNTYKASVERRGGDVSTYWPLGLGQ